MVNPSMIDVVLPTYNGVAYLEEQLHSIYMQTLKPCKVLIRDDGSTDGTQSLIFRLMQRYGAWLEVLPNDGNLGCVANVNCLLEASQSPYVALADQDDIWMPHKLEYGLALLQQLEHEHGAETPLLVHSDLSLVDTQARPIASSYFQHQRLNPFRTTLEDIALTNVVTGCSVLCNRNLLKQALPIPTKALMHDWWLALVASGLGHISCIDKPLVYYRQHESNVLGAQGLGFKYWLKRIKSFLKNPGAGGNLRASFQQIICFEKRYGTSLTTLSSILSLPRRNRWFVLAKIPHSRRPKKHGFLRSLGLYCLLLTLPSE